MSIAYDLRERKRNIESEQYEAEYEAKVKKALTEVDLIKGENEAKVIVAKM